MKVSMFAKIGAIASGLSLNVNLPHQVTLYERIKAVIHSGKRDGWHLSACSDKYLVGSGMISLVHEDIKNMFALFCVTHSLASDGILQSSLPVVGGYHVIIVWRLEIKKGRAEWSLSGTITIKKMIKNQFLSERRI